MSKSLQKGIIFAVCILLVCALGVTLFIFDGTGGAVTGQEGQASGVADAAANAYEHGTDSGRRPAGTYTPVSTGEAFYNAIKSNTQDILLTGNITLTSSVSVSTSGNLYWNDGSQCFMQNTPFSHKIYGAGYTITVQGPHTSSEGMQMNNNDINEYGGLVSELQNGGAIYDVKVVITKGFAVQTWETWSTLTGGTRDYWLNVGGLVGYMNGGSQIDNVYVELTDSTVRLASFKYISDGSPPEYVRAGAIVGEMGANATITNVTVNNKGLIVAGKNTGDASHSVCAERWYGAVGNVVGWISARGGNVTLDNIRITGNGTLRGYKVGNIAVAENSNVNTGNFFDNFTGTYESYENGYHKVYVNGNTGSVYNVTNVYRKGSASVDGAGETVASGMKISATLTVPSDSAYDIYFDATVLDDRNNSLAIAFNQAPAASYEYTLVSGNETTYKNPETTSNAIVFRNLPTAAATWNRGGNFTATLNSELLFNPDTYENPLDRYEHGYTEGQTTSTGTAISTGDEWENIFAPSASGTPSDTYYLTDDIVINGFTGKSMSGVTIDGNGKTIFVIGTTQSSYSGTYVGGLVGDFTGGTIKNVRVVYLSLAGEISFTMSTERGGRVGLLAGRITNSTIENVQVRVDEGVTVNATASNDTQFAMGGLIGEAATGSNITGATVDLNGELNPSGKWQFLGGIVGVVQSANTSGTSATVKMENIIIRGAGTLSGNALNDNQPTFTAAVAVLMPTTGAVPAVPFVTIDGLIYDFNVKLNGQLNGTGGTGNQYACYYLFTYNYNDYRSDGWQTGSPISEYNKAVSYSNVFVNSAYIKELEGDENGPGYAQQRTNGNAAVGGAVINTVQNKVEGLENPVAAYFNPVDGADDMIFRASGTWDEDRMVILALSDGTVRKSVLETAGVNTSAKLVYAPKTLAATANVVQLSLYENVDWPTAPAALTYSGEEQSFAFTLQTVSGTPVESSDYTVTYSVKEGNTGVLGENNLPLNAGTYTATITLTNGMEFIDDGQGTTSSEYSLTVEVQKKELSITSSATEEDPYKPHISAVYGATGDKAAVQGLLTWNTIGSYITGNYNGEEVSFTIDKIYIAATDEISGEFTLAGAEEVADENIASLDANSYLITVTEDSGNYTVAEGQFFVYGVTPATLTVTGVTFEGGFDGVYDGQAHNVAVQYSGLVGSDVAYNFNITVTGVDGIAVTNAGDYTVTVAADEYNPNYDVTYEGMNEYTVTVEKADYDMTGVTFENASFEYDGTEKTITVSGTLPTGADGIQVTVSYSGTNGTALTNAGSTEITATFATTSTNYNVPEATKTATLTVTPVTLTINEISGNYTDYTAADIVIDDMVSGILEGDTEGVTVTPAWDTPLADENGYLAAGTYNATLSLSGDKSANYTFGSDNIATVTVDQFDLTKAHITITSEQFTYDGKEKTVEYTVLTAEGGKDITALLTAEGDKQTNANAENAKYTVTLSGDDNFTGTATADWSIDQKTLTISPFTAYFLDYESSGSLYAYLTNAESDLITGVIDGDTITFSGVWATTPATAEGTSYVAAGSYTLNMNAPGNANYKFENNAMSVTINALDIGGAEVAVTWNESGLTYTAEEQSVSLDSVTVNGVALPVGWFNLANNTGTDAKTYTANIAANNPNITGSTDKEFTIDPASVTFAWSVSGEIVEGMAVEEVKALANPTNNGGILEADTYTFGVDIGDYTAETPHGTQVTFTPSVTFTEGGDAANYNITFDPATITKTVAATPVTVKPVNGEQTVIYGSSVTSAAEFIAAAYFTIESGAEDAALTEDNFTVTVMGDNGAAVFGTHGLAAGTYIVTIEGKGAYSVSNEDNSFTYNVDPLTLTAGTWSGVNDLTYDGNAAEPVFTPEGVLDGDSVNPAVTVTGDKVTSGQAVNAGAYTATAESDNVNYKFDGVANVKEFTIAQMVLEGKWVVDEEMDMTYDGTDKSAYVTWTWTTALLNDGDVTFEITFNGEKTAVNAGNYTATVTFTDSTGNYDTESGILQGGRFDEMTIKPRPVEITWTAPADLTYSAEAKVPTATISNNVGTDEVTATIITYNGNNTDVTAEGFTATVTELTGAAKDNYTLEGGKGITSEKYTITALAVSYKWSFADSAAITYGDGVEDVKALVTLPDGAPLLGTEEKVTFEVSVGDYSETTSAGSTVTFTVTAKLPEGVNADNYNITVNAKDGNTLTVNKAQITFTGNAVTEQKIVGETLTLSQEDLLASKYYTITPTPDSTYSVGGKLSVTSVTKDGQPITADGNGYTFTEAGEYIVTYAITAGENDNYAPVSDTFTATLTVSEEAISLTPTWGEYTFTYNGEAQYPVPTFNQTPDDGAIVYTVTARGDSALTDNSAVNAGDYTVTISVAEGFTQKYEFAEDATLTFDFTIDKREAQLSWSDEDATYDGQEHILTATVDNKVEGDDVTVEVELVADNDNINVTEQGFYFTAIGFTGTDAGNYKLPADVQSGKFDINPAEIALTWNFVENSAVTYGMTVEDVEALVDTAAITATIPGAEAPLTFTVSVGEYTAATNAGAEVTFTINYNLPEGAIAANYNITVSAANGDKLTIEKATLTLTQAEGASLSKEYDGEVVDPQSLLTAKNVTVAGMQNGEDAFELGILSIAAEADSEIKNAAEYKLTVSVNEGNYTADVLELTYTVTAKLIGVEWRDTQFTYDGAAHKPTATATGLVGDETLILTVTGEQINASESAYTATVTKDSVTGNYMLNEDATTQFTIAPKSVSVAWSNTQFTYDGTEKEPTATVGVDQGLVDGDDLVITVEGAQINANTDGAYTATAVITGGADMVNYTLDSTATTSFTIAPATLNVSVVIAGDGVAENTLTWKVEAEVTVSGNSEEGWTLTSGGTSYIVTVTGADGVALDVLQLTLNGSEYNGTPYGTRVQNGKLGVASTNPNYTVELVTPININIVPDISIEINTGEGYENTAVYNVNTTYTTADFEDYFYIDGQPEGTWAYSVEGVESGSFSNVGTYTVKATFTITASSSIPLENHFTFTITQATVTGVELSGDGVYTYGGLKAGDTVSVMVTYSDGYTATVDAEFTADMSTGGYVIAGETVSLTLTGDDGANANYAQVDGQTVTVSVSKAGITADIYYEDTVSVDSVLTLPYIGSAGYAVSVSLEGVLDGDGVKGELETEIINAKTYGNLTFALHGDDSYEITNAAALSVVVTPAEITVVWDNYDGLTYDGTAKAPTATAEGTFDSDEVTLTVTVAGDNATDTDGTMTAVNAGDYTATVAAFVQGNYKLSADSVQSFSIAKASATLNIDDYNTIMGSTYTGSAVTITPTINGEEDTQGIVAVSITDEADAPVQEIVNVGKYSVTLSVTGNMNYEDASQSFDVKVSPASLEVTTANTSFEYGNTIDLGASVTALGDDVVTVAIESVTVDDEAAELKNVGTYTVTYKLEGEDSGNYSITAGGSVTVTITAKELTITWSDETFTYNGSAQAPDYSADFIEGEEIELTVTITGNSASSEGQAINAGEYTARIAKFEQGNYKLTSNSTKTFTIGRADLTLTPSEVSFSNRNEEMMDKFSSSSYIVEIPKIITVTGVGNDDVFNNISVTTGGGATYGDDGKLTVGTHTFLVSAKNNNYNDATLTVKVTEQEVVTLTATPSSDVYTGSAITFTFGDEVLPDGVEITYTVQKEDGSPAESVLDAGKYTVTFTVSNSTDNDKWYEVTAWSGTISPATVTAEDAQAVYGEVFTAAATGTELQRVGGWQIVTFNGSPVEVTVTVTDSAAASAARAGEVYLGAGGYEINIQLVSSNFTFGASSAQTKQLTVARKQLELAPELPSDLTYSSDGIVIGTPDHASQLVGDDAVEVTMLIDGQPYVAGETVLSAGEHTVTFTITDASDNYDVADTSSSTFTVAKKSVTPSINVAGDKVENNSTLEMDKGENMRVQTAIDNFIADNGIKEGEYTLSVKDASGADKKLDEIAAWAPGTYTVTVALGDNYDGSLTFSIVVKEGTTAQIPEPPALPSTPLEDSGSSLSTTDWLFPLIIAVECLIAAVLVAAIVIAAIKRSK